MDLRSKNVTQGVERAPNRSLFYAMGYTKEELERPLIGVVSAHSEICLLYTSPSPRDCS